MYITLRRNKMKKIILILAILLVCINYINAQDEEIKITLIEYNPETNFARIQIENTLETDLHNVYFQLDTLPSRLMTPTLAAKASSARVLNVPEGIHTVKITSDELTISKDLSFSASVEEKLKEFEDTQREQRREVTRDLAFEQELQKNAPITEKTSSTKIIFITIGVLLIIVIIGYIIFSRKNETV